MRLKRSIFLVVIVLLSAFTSANADVYNGSGQVQIIRLHDAVNFPERDWIGVSGFSSAGTCVVNSGVVVLRLRNDGGGKNILATALTARAMEQDVIVSVDDTVKDPNGQCYLRYMNIL